VGQAGGIGQIRNKQTQMSADFLEFMAQIWRDQPSLIVFLALGLVVFVCLVVDSHRLHRKRSIRQRMGLY
jgi:hypothetical protein